MKFPRVDGGDRGRPRTNKGDKTGSVRVLVSLTNGEGNITRSLTVSGQVSKVFAAIESAIVKK
jgi:hypothetical protein